MTQDALAKRLGLTKATVSQWETGHTAPNGKNLINLADALTVSAEWLLAGKAGDNASDHPMSSDASFPDPIAIGDSAPRREEDHVDIPFYREIQRPNATDSVVEVDHSGEKVRFSKTMLQKAGVDVSHVACVNVCGNSMAPVLPDGAVIGIDTASISIKDGQLYAINHGGLLRVKILYRLPQGIRIRSFNRDEYADEEYFNSDVGKINVIGKVFWYFVLL